VILVSACLAGEKCRYDGGSARHEALARLAREGRALAVCPEVLGGLPTPRAPHEIRDGRVVDRDGRDHTEAFRTGAAQALAMALEAGCVKAVLKSRSPSCGSGLVYDGAFSGRLVQGDGVLAALLKANGLVVLTDLEFQA
jgi:uncharacterized protein YbbK (DUF523 family)